MMATKEPATGSESDWKITDVHHAMSPRLLTYVASYINVSERQRFALEELKITNHEYKVIENTKREEERNSQVLFALFILSNMFKKGAHVTKFSPSLKFGPMIFTIRNVVAERLYVHRHLLFCSQGGVWQTPPG